MENLSKNEQELVQELRDIVAGLNDELKERTNTLERQRKNSIAFEGDVEEAENYFMTQLDEHRERIKTLEGKLTDQTKRGEELLKREKDKVRQVEEEYRACHDKQIHHNKQMEDNLREAKERLRQYAEEELCLLETLNEKELQNQRLQDVIDAKSMVVREFVGQSDIATPDLSRDMLDKETQASAWEVEINECRRQVERLEELLKDESQKRKREKEFYMNDVFKYREEVDELKRKLKNMSVAGDKQKEHRPESIKVGIRECLDIKTGAIRKAKSKCTGSPLKAANDRQQKNGTQLKNDKQHQNNQTATSINDKVSKNKKPDILIMGSRSDFNYGKIFKHVTGNKYDTNCQNADNGLLENITHHHEKLSQRFNKYDYKIILTSSENARKGKSITNDQFQKMFSSSQHTNTLIVGAPLVEGKTALNKLILSQNSKIEDYVKDLENITYVESNKILKPYHVLEGKITNRGKWELTKYICQNYIIQVVSRSTQTYHPGKTSSTVASGCEVGDQTEVENGTEHPTPNAAFMDTNIRPKVHDTEVQDFPTPCPNQNQI